MSQTAKKIPLDANNVSGLQLVPLDGLEVGITDLPGVTYVFISSLSSKPEPVSERRITDLALTLCDAMIIEPFRTVFIELNAAGTSNGDKIRVLNIEWLDNFPIHVSAEEVTNNAHARFLETLATHTHLKPFHLNH